MLKKLMWLFIVILISVGFSSAINLAWCYKKTFKVSAYYSPIWGQKFYYRWNFYQEKRLNGQWIRWASWKRVFNGMLAAGKKYKFWTKIYFPWLWVGQVEDRWSAIVHAGQRWQKYDRIDIWVGKWDKALMRALSFGKQVRIWYVCPPRKKIKVWFDYSKFNILSNFFQKTLWWIGLSYGRKDPWVKSLQEYLKKLWYMNYKATWYYGYLTKKAVTKFQKSMWIKTRYYGYFWPKTRYALRKVLKQKWIYKKAFQKINIVKKDNSIVKKELSLLNRWLWKWYNTYEVKILQKYLKKLWYYNGPVNWFYDDKTLKAVAKFQVENKIIKNKNIAYAGYFWPKTRTKFKQIVISNF